jgi:hypothetical protein
LDVMRSCYNERRADQSRDRHALPRWAEQKTKIDDELNCLRVGLVHFIPQDSPTRSSRQLKIFHHEHSQAIGFLG